MKEVKTTVVNPNGIHARPASFFVNEAKKYQSKRKKNKNKNKKIMVK